MVEDEVLEQESEEAQTGEELQPEEAQGEPSTAEEEPQEDEEKEELTISYGDDSDEIKINDPAPGWAKDLRKRHARMKSENHQLRQKIEELIQPKKTSDPGPMPTLEGCSYDETDYANKMADWSRRKTQAEQMQRAAQAEQQKIDRHWQEKLTRYTEKKRTLNVPDYDDAESTVQGQFNVTQQGIIVQGADDPALVVYAIGKNPKKAEELAAINEPVQFAFAIAKMEAGLKLGKKRKPPAPERKLSGATGSTTGSVDNQLDRLRAEAEKTGDYTQVIKYRNKKRRRS